MKLKMPLKLALILLTLALIPAFAADIAGTWKATFDTQIGEQHYTYLFKADGEKLTGKATSDNGSVEITEGTIKGDDVFFVEMLDFQGNRIRIEYKGKVTGDEIKFTRQVGEFATEQIVAKRQK